MGDSFQFDSTFIGGNYMYERWSQLDVKNEPMLFNCSIGYAWANAGPITRDFLLAAALPEDAVIDTRVHMLMPGWYPCIPGWHHDDVPRSRGDGQPNYVNPEYHAQHAVALINGDICPTEFAVGRCDMPGVPSGDIIYKAWHPLVEDAFKLGHLVRWRAHSNRIIYFDSHAFHQGVAATAGGWRWFGRASWNTHRKPTNEIRRQVQVYLEFPMEGW